MITLNLRSPKHKDKQPNTGQRARPLQIPTNFEVLQGPSSERKTALSKRHTSDVALDGLQSVRSSKLAATTSIKNKTRSKEDFEKPLEHLQQPLLGAPNEKPKPSTDIRIEDKDREIANQLAADQAINDVQIIS